LVCWPLFGLLYQPQMIDDDCGAIGGIRIGRGYQCTRRKPGPVPLSPLQIPHNLTCDRTRAAAVESRRLNRLSCGKAEVYVGNAEDMPNLTNIGNYCTQYRAILETEPGRRLVNRTTRNTPALGQRPGIRRINCRSPT
jgi:hypothetical protein